MIDNYSLIALVVAAYLVAGVVKGVMGMGLPTVALALLASVITPAQAAAIMIAPSFATNIWQMLAGPYLLALLKRLGGMMAGMFVGGWLGAGVLTGGNAKPAAIGLGIVLIIYSLIGLSKLKLSVPRGAEWWLAPIVGVATGVVMAATGVFVLPALPYLQAIGLEKDELVQALGLHFTTGTVALAIVLWSGGAFNVALGVISLLAIVPAIAGMVAGQYVRQRLSGDTFRWVFYIGLILLGLNLIVPNML